MVYHSVEVVQVGLSLQCSQAAVKIAWAPDLAVVKEAQAGCVISVVFLWQVLNASALVVLAYEALQCRRDFSTWRASTQASAEITRLSACACLPVAAVNDYTESALHVDMANKGSAHMALSVWCPRQHGCQLPYFSI